MIQLNLHIGINATRTNAIGWGELAYAEQLISCFQSLGHHATLFFRGEAPLISGDSDAVIHIFGPHLDEPVAGVPNLLWLISPPNVAPLATLRRYQAIFVASEWMASYYRELGVNAVCLLQATNAELFNPHANPTGKDLFDVVFVGNRAPRAPRKNVIAAINAGFNVRVWGGGWEKVIPKVNFGGKRLDLTELAQVYASARIVLNDHMAAMAAFGFMSNRSFDALACGAGVICEPINGFNAPELPLLQQVGANDDLAAAIENMLNEWGGDRAGRIAASEPGLRSYKFESRAETLANEATRLIEENKVASRIWHPVQIAPPEAAPTKVILWDANDKDSLSTAYFTSVLDKFLLQGPLEVELHLVDPSTTPPGLSLKEGLLRAATAIERIGIVLARRDAIVSLAVSPPAGEHQAGYIHALMADHREAQMLAQSPLDDAATIRLRALAQRARRLIELLEDPPHPVKQAYSVPDEILAATRYLNNAPPFPASPEGFSRDRQKRHVVLWPRKNKVTTKRPVGVFIHLFYPELAPVFRARLEKLDVTKQVYVSTDTNEKRKQIQSVLPEADVRVFPNRGRDIFPKLFGFSDAYDDHDFVLHLHGKKSAHSERLDGWLDHCLNSLLPNVAETNRIVSFLNTAPKVGILAPLTYRPLLPAAHWGFNCDIAHELHKRIGLPEPLPSNADLDFPVGSMFWARTSAIRPIIDLRLTPDHFPMEEGQLDGTVAHAIERLLGVVCAATGYHLVRIAPSGNNDFRQFQVHASSNADVRDALSDGRL